MRKILFPLVLVLLWSAGPAGAEFYRWTDRDGREFFTNDTEKIPPAYRSTARSVDVQDDRVSRGQQSATEPSREAVSPRETDRNGRGEEYWRSRAEDLRRRLGEVQAEHDRLVQQERTGRPASKKARTARERRKQRLAQKIAALQRELDVELPEEARRAEALPGWLR